MNPLEMVASFFKGGGPFMFIILGIAVLIIATAFERMLVIMKAGSVNAKKMMNDMVARVSKGDLNGARAISKKSGAPVAQVAQAILETGPADEQKLQMAADDQASIVLPPLTRRLQFLNTLANTATLLGLLGTIFGLTTAFSAVGAADPSQRAAFLAAGISQALNTTAFGLIVAVPTLLIHGWLSGLVEGIADSVDEMSVRLSQAMGRNSAPQSAVTPNAGANVYSMNAESDPANQPRRAAQGGSMSWDDGGR